MDDLDAALATTTPEPVTATSTTTPRKCRRHDWMRHTINYLNGYPLDSPEDRCNRCLVTRDTAVSRRSRNNRKRGNAAELDVARAVGGRKVGPLGLPWDVEMPGYARLQVRKLASPPSINDIRKALDAIAATPSEAMPGYVWIEPGRGGDQLIVFRLRDWQERHGTIPSEDPA